MDRRTRIAVVGAGLGGLTVAGFLQRAGFAATVYEQDSVIEFLKTLQVLPPEARELMVYRDNAVKKSSTRKP